MKRRVLGLLLFLLIIPLFMGCDQTREATTTQMSTEESTEAMVALGTVTFEIYTAGDNPDTDDVVETEYVSNSMEVSYFEEDTLFNLLDENFTITFETSDFGRYLTGIDTLIVTETNEYISFYINDGYAQTGVDDTDLADGSVYQFKLETF